MEQDWERHRAMPVVSTDEIRALLAPHDIPVLSVDPLTGGLVNGLYRVETPQGPRVMRIYLRDPLSAVVERDLAARLVDVPMPRPVVWGETPWTWVLQTWCPGRRMAEVLPSVDGPGAYALGFSAARWLHVLRRQRFDRPAELGPGLTATRSWDDLQDQHRCFLDALLEASRTQLPPGMSDAIRAYVEQIDGLYEGPVVLCHADYKPTNLLVEGTSVSAILDWEFSFASSSWFDVGQLLRWADEVPSSYTDGVLAGLSPDLPDNAVALGRGWDLVNLVHQASQAATRPKVGADALDRIRRTLSSALPRS